MTTLCIWFPFSCMVRFILHICMPSANIHIRWRTHRHWERKQSPRSSAFNWAIKPLSYLWWRGKWGHCVPFSEDHPGSCVDTRLTAVERNETLTCTWWLCGNTVSALGSFISRYCQVWILRLLDTGLVEGQSISVSNAHPGMRIL